METPYWTEIILKWKIGKWCRTFCSFPPKQIVMADLASPWCTDHQQWMLLDRFICDVEQASRFNYTAWIVSCESSCSCHLKLKMWQRWIWKVFCKRYLFVKQNPNIPAHCLHLGVFVFKTSSNAQLPDWKRLCTFIPAACFRYCSTTWWRYTNSQCFVFLGRPGIAVEQVDVKSFVCKSTNLTACRLVPSIISVVQNCNSLLKNWTSPKSVCGKSLCAVSASIIEKSPHFWSSIADFTEPNQLSATNLLPLLW